jgi:hypothetical protein
LSVPPLPKIADHIGADDAPFREALTFLDVNGVLPGEEERPAATPCPYPLQANWLSSEGIYGPAVLHSTPGGVVRALSASCAIEAGQ